MVYLVCVGCPIATEFYKELGANDFHFGLIGGLPILMLSFQFVGAFLSNRVKSRKGLFMTLVILGRMVYIPIALLPLLFPSLSKDIVLTMIIILIALSSAMGNMTGPLWFSWMADLVPTRVLNHYWGTRQGWLHWTWSATFLLVIVYSYFVDLPVKYAFPLIAIPGVIAGVVDIILFIWVEEPPNTIIKGIPLLQIFTEPLRHREYRSFLLFSCSFAASTMFAAAFMQIYVLKVLHLAVWKTSLVWCIVGLGLGFSSKKWGKLADRYGQKPILVFCSILKPFIAVVFILLTPENVVWMLPGFFLLDSFWNAGIQVGTNGFMMKLSPKENRSMFVAALIALGGICGGLAAIVSGAFLQSISGFSYDFAGVTWTNYRIVFAISFLLRVGCVFLALRVNEPKSSSTLKVLNDIRCGWPLRLIRFPVGLYKSKD